MEYKSGLNIYAQFSKRFLVFFNSVITAISDNNPDCKDKNPGNFIRSKKVKEGGNDNSGKKAYGKKYVIKPYTSTRVPLNHILPIHDLIIYQKPLDVIKDTQ